MARKFTKKSLDQISKTLVKRQHLSIPFNDKTSKITGGKPNGREASVLIPICNYKNAMSILYTLRTGHVSTHKNEVSFPGGHVESDETNVYAALREFHEECGCYFNINIWNTDLKNNQKWLNKTDLNLLKTQPFSDTNNNNNNNTNDNKKNIGIDGYKLTAHILGPLFEFVPSKHGSKVMPIVAFLDITKNENYATFAKNESNNMLSTDMTNNIINENDDNEDGNDNKVENSLLNFMNPQVSEVEETFMVQIDTLLDKSIQSWDDLPYRGKIIRYKINPQPIWGLTAFLTNEMLNHVIQPCCK